MAVDLQRGVTVILEDAYKQNRVYRSWEDIQLGETQSIEAPLPLAKAIFPADTASAGSVG